MKRRIRTKRTPTDGVKVDVFPVPFELSHLGVMQNSIDNNVFKRKGHPRAKSLTKIFG